MIFVAYVNTSQTVASYGTHKIDVWLAVHSVADHLPDENHHGLDLWGMLLYPCTDLL
jgi:hypothetical protein